MSNNGNVPGNIRQHTAWWPLPTRSPRPTPASISGNGGVLKIGPGTLSFSAAQTYSGGTTVNGGTLEVNSTLASPTVTVNTGGALAGAGTVNNVVVNAGGSLSPGVGLSGTLTAAAVTLNSGAAINVEHHRHHAQRQLSAANLTLGGGNNLQLNVGRHAADRHGLHVPASPARRQHHAARAPGPSAAYTAARRRRQHDG